VIFLLDTNVLSEATEASPDPGVVNFIRAVPAENVRLSAVVLAEIAQGVENNPTPQLQQFLADMLQLPLVELGKPRRWSGAA